MVGSSDPGGVQQDRLLHSRGVETITVNGTPVDATKGVVVKAADGTKAVEVKKAADNTKVADQKNVAGQQQAVGAAKPADAPQAKAEAVPQGTKAAPASEMIAEPRILTKEEVGALKKQWKTEKARLNKDEKRKKKEAKEKEKAERMANAGGKKKKKKKEKEDNPSRGVFVPGISPFMAGNRLAGFSSSGRMAGIGLGPFRRDEGSGFTAIPATYGAQHHSPAPAAVAGITLGSVAAFVLVLMLVYFGLNRGRRARIRAARSEADIEEEKLEGLAPVRKTHRHHHRRAGAERTTEVRSHERLPPRRVDRETYRETTVVVEPPAPSPTIETEEPDLVVVEEQLEPEEARHKHRHHHHHHGYRREQRQRARESGFRGVDPTRFAGGDEPVREVRRSVRRASRRE